MVDRHNFMARFRQLQARNSKSALLAGKDAVSPAGVAANFASGQLVKMTLMSVAPNNRIEPIKLTRELCNLGLKEAKDLNDMVMNGNHIDLGTFPYEKPKSFVSAS